MLLDFPGLEVIRLGTVLMSLLGHMHCSGSDKEGEDERESLCVHYNYVMRPEAPINILGSIILQSGIKL